VLFRNLAKARIRDSYEYEEKIKKIKQQWLDEADEIIKHDDEKNMKIHHFDLDGEASLALAKIQDKYKKQIQEVLNK
jgi:predicted RNA-binding protein with RPS1 domain